MISRIFVAFAAFSALFCAAQAAEFNVEFTIDAFSCAASWWNGESDFKCDKSFHCVDTTAGTVYGTWGMFGHFYGTVSAGRVATVSYLQQDRTTGTAQWTYAPDYQSVSGVTGLPATVLTVMTAGNASAVFDPNVWCMKPLYEGSTCTLPGKWQGPTAADDLEWHCTSNTEYEFGSYKYGSTNPPEFGTLSGQYFETETLYAGDWVATVGEFYPYNGAEVERADCNASLTDRRLWGMYCEYERNSTGLFRSYCETYQYTRWSAETDEARVCYAPMLANTPNGYSKKESYADSVYPKIWLGVTIAFFAILSIVFFMKWKQAEKAAEAAKTSLPTSKTETVNPIGSSR